jgi:hypothetical protein
LRFYNEQHAHYCGIDLHAKTRYVCVLDRDGKVLAHRNLPASPEAFLEAIAPFREQLVVAVECIFTCWAASEKQAPRARRQEQPPVSVRPWGDVPTQWIRAKAHFVATMGG